MNFHVKKMAGSFFLIFIFLFAIGISPFLTAQSVQAEPSTQTMKGQVLIISEDLYVVQNKEGKGMPLNVSKGTKVDKGVKVGDQVEATFNEDGTALAIKKAQK